MPEAVSSGVGTDSWDGLVKDFLLASAIFLFNGVLTVIQGSLGEVMSRRVDGWVQVDFLATSLSSTGIAPLEDAAALDALTEVNRWFEGRLHTTGSACAGMLALIAH